MSEYWKSTPKYWCKHCSLYVKDTPFERKQHESTGKHQGNLKRFLRGIQNDHEQNQRDKQKVKDEIERLNRVVGSASTPSSQAPATTKTGSTRQSASANLTAADQKRQWAQLAEMGIAVPENFRGEMAMAGNWQSIAEELKPEDASEEPLSKGVRKRKLEEHEIEDEEGEQTVVRRGWGRSMRQYPGERVEDDDLDLLLRAPLPKKETTGGAEIKRPLKADAIIDSKSVIDMDVGIKQEKESHPHEDGSGGNDAPGQTVDPELSVKSEEAGSKQSPDLGDKDGIPSMPVFKKRKAKAK